MAEQNGNGHQTRVPDRPTTLLAIDLDALLPSAPSRRVRIEGIEYPVRQLIHFSEQEELDLRNLERILDEAAKQTDPRGYETTRRAAYDMAFWLVRALVPDLPDAVRRRIRLDQAWAIAGIGRLAVSENPPSADTGAANVAAAENSTPVSADSTASIQDSSAA